jgi:hypothetical protein
MKKWKLFSVLIAAFVFGMGATYNSNDKEEGEFKNLKVLPKDISEHSLDSVMKSYCIALDVRCGFCHARSKDTTQKHLDFASDEKEEKGTARDMIRMVNGLNTINFNYMHSTKPDTIHTIICYTCHRGMQQPTASNLMPEIKKVEEEKQKEWQKQHGK